MLLGAALPVCVELTLPVVLEYDPPAAAVTLTVIEQLALPPKMPPERLTLPLPAAPPVIVPAQVFVKVGDAAITNPEGNVSLNATPDSGKALLFDTVSVNVDTPLLAIAAGENDFTMVGFAATLKVADAVFPVPPLVALTAPVTLV